MEKYRPLHIADFLKPNPRKVAYTKSLLNQAAKVLKHSIESRNKLQFEDEIESSINCYVLLGLCLEGFINEIGECKFDKKIWGDIEKISTISKFMLFPNDENRLESSGKEYSTLKKLIGIRNKLAHPKLKNSPGDKTIITDKNQIILDPQEDEIPNGVGFAVFTGIQEGLSVFNSWNLFNDFKQVIQIFEIVATNDWKESNYNWLKEIEKEIKGCVVIKNEFNES